MLMRSNALSNAIAVRVNHDNPERYGYTEEMAVLEEMRREADEALERYKAEVGFKA
jgi:RPA family protein